VLPKRGGEGQDPLHTKGFGLLPTPCVWRGRIPHLSALDRLQCRGFALFSSHAWWVRTRLRLRTSDRLWCRGFALRTWLDLTKGVSGTFNRSEHLGLVNVEVVAKAPQTLVPCHPLDRGQAHPTLESTRREGSPEAVGAHPL
jgi:hypothetical protein